MQAEVTGSAEDSCVRYPAPHCWIIDNQHPCIDELIRSCRELIPTDRYPVLVESKHRKICPSSPSVTTSSTGRAADDETEESKCSLWIFRLRNTNQDR